MYSHKHHLMPMYDLLQNKVFIFEVHDGMPKNMFTINYELAYTVSLGFIFTTLVAQYKNIGREDLANKLFFKFLIANPYCALSSSVNRFSSEAMVFKMSIDEKILKRFSNRPKNRVKNVPF